LILDKQHKFLGEFTVNYVDFHDIKTKKGKKGRSKKNEKSFIHHGEVQKWL
jgi:hypothetical protein